MFKFLKKKIKGKGLVSDRYFQLKIKEVIKETDDTNTLIFENPDKPFHYLPGQFLTLILPIKNEKVRRSYSLCTSPFSGEPLAITVKRIESGLISNYLNDHMKPGDVFDVMEAAGHFVPELKKQNKKNYILFAAGSGITPIMSIIKSILAIEPESEINLVYQNRDADNVIFKDALKKISDEHPERFAQIDVFSQPKDNWTGYQGRIDSAMASDILLDIAGNKVNKAEYFLCGPLDFMQTIFEVLCEFEVPENHIHKESFYSGEAKAKIKETAKSDLSEFDVIIKLDGEEYEVHVPGNKTILEAALDQDIDMPFSCQSGLCTACRGKLLEGNVEMSDEDGLSEEELNQGYILNCVSRPTGPGVKIEIG